MKCSEFCQVFLFSKSFLSTSYELVLRVLRIKRKWVDTLGRSPPEVSAGNKQVREQCSRGCDGQKQGGTEWVRWSQRPNLLVMG